MQLNLFRWGILLKVLPVTALFCLAKWGVHTLGWEIWKFDLMTGSLFGVATFVMAFMLSGTLSDYRTSEDMVSQVASSIETIQDTALFASVNHIEYNPTPLVETLVRVLKSILGWLKHGESFDAVNLALTDLNPLFARLEKVTSGPVISRIQAEQGKIRFIMTRMKLIRGNDFMAPAYVLLQIFLVGTILALLLISGDLFSKTIIVSGFLFTSFLYLVILICDLDNPFQYDGKSSIEVDLEPLLITLDRLQTNLQSSEVILQSAETI